VKSVLISIQPKWCELITIGKKTVEVRKTRPKIEVPFKCYIYETKGKTDFPTFIDEDGHEIYEGRGQVIGEFVCDRIEEIGFSPYNHGEYISEFENLHKVSCIDFEQMFDYIADGYGYGWHISDLVIYDSPKELSKYRTLCKGQYKDCRKCGYFCSEGCESTGFFESCCVDGVIPLTRPPQSWCYVEEIRSESNA
jgi:predicted transcriptional regulator